MGDASPRRLRSAALVPLLLVALAAVGWWIFGHTDAPGAAATTTAAEAVENGESIAAAAAPAPAASLLRSDATVAEEKGTIASTEPEAGEPLGILLRGRCVALESGAPLAGVEIRLTGRAMMGARITSPARPDPDPVRTGADGCFALEAAPAADLEWALSARHPERELMRKEWPHGLAAGPSLDLGDLALRRGAIVRGRVEDEHGKAVPDVYLRLEPELMAGSSEEPPLTPGTRADDAGEFSFSSTLRAGAWRFGTASGGITIVEPELLRIGEDLAPQEVLLKVRWRESIRGEIVDAAGAPIADVAIRAIEERGFPREQTRSREDGSFTLYRRDSVSAPSALELSGPSVSPLRVTGHFPWGSEGHRLQAERALRGTIRVVEKAYGLPVERYAVRIARSGELTDLSPSRHAGEHVDGRLDLDGLQRGDNFVLILPEDRDLLPNRGARVIGGAEGETTIELERMEPLQVAVRFADGTPVPGSTVRILDERPRFARLWLDPYDENRSISGAGVLPRLLDTAVTGTDGLLTLLVPPSEEEVHLQASGPHRTVAVDVVRPLMQPQPLVLLVPAGSALHGVVRLPWGQEEKFRLMLMAMRGENQRERVGRGDPELLGADGSFRFDALEPNVYWLHLAVRKVTRRPDGASGEAWSRIEEPLAEVMLAAGEERQLELDASAFGFGELTAEFRIGDEPAAAALVSLARRPELRADEGWNVYGAFSTDADGRLLATDLEPGTYRATLLYTAATGGPVELLSESEVEVRAGERADAAFTFHPRVLRLQFLDDESGAPLADRLCVLNPRLGSDPPRFLHNPFVNPLRTDRDGGIEILGVLPGRYVASVMGTGTTSLSEEFEVADPFPSERLVLRARPVR